MNIQNLLNFNFLATHLVFVGLFIVLALSLSVINGCAGMFSLGHQGFWAVGAYSAGATAVVLVNSMPGPIAFAITLIAGVAAATTAGLLVGLPCMRLRGDYLAVVTLGFAEIVRVLLNNLEAVGGSRGLRVPTLILAKSPETAVTHFTFYLLLSGTSVVVTAIVCRNLLRSGHGRAVLAARDDETAAELTGVPVDRYRLGVFALGAGFAGLVGGIYANFFGVLSPKDFGLNVGIFLLIIVVLGGRGSLGGAAIAAIVLYGSQQILKLRLLGLPSALLGEWGETVEQFATDRWQLVFSGLLIVLVVALPNGFQRGAK